MMQAVVACLDFVFIMTRNHQKETAWSENGSRVILWLLEEWIGLPLKRSFCIMS